MSDEDYKAQLLAVETRLAKDPENEELISLRSDLLDAIELLEEEIPQETQQPQDQPQKQQSQPTTSSQPSSKKSNNTDGDEPNSKNNFKKNAKKKKKPAKRFDEPDTSAWQSFSRQRGLKGVVKRSIFESPQSVTGKVGVGTNGIADAPVRKGASSAPKRRNQEEKDTRAKMMGSPYYYEVHFDPIDMVFHDCMWSGTCCIQLVQQPPETVVQQQHHQEQQQRQSAAEHLAQQISLASSSQVPIVKQQHSPASFQSCKQTTSASSTHSAGVQQYHSHSDCSKRLDASSDISDDDGSESSFEAHPKSEPAVKQTRQQAKQQAANKQHQLHLQRKQHHHHHARAAGGDNSATNNKKLRHREVEKNRHRQLQAMVKTLSDRIPGKIDKETQVQTMRRAAKYCLYLRDVLAHGPPPVTKEKLERIYSKSCESVDMLMSSD